MFHGPGPMFQIQASLHVRKGLTGGGGVGTIGDMKRPIPTGVIAGVAVLMACSTTWFWYVMDTLWPWVPALGLATGSGFWIGYWFQATRHAKREQGL